MESQLKLSGGEGVTKTHSLTYESVEVMHALFDKNRATNSWKVKSKMLRGIMEYFGAKAEQLDIYAEYGKVTFTSYTEKIMHGKGNDGFSKYMHLAFSNFWDRSIETTTADGGHHRHERLR